MNASDSSHQRRWRLGVDVGGTFTDVALVDETSGEVVVSKTPTRRDDLVGGVLAAVRDGLIAAQVDAADVVSVAAGSTTVLNTILERAGNRTGLLVTRGFRDVLEIRRTRLPDAPSFNAARPVALVRRALVAEVNERLDAGGRVLRPLDPADLLAQAERLVAAGVEALAIAFLHAHTNPEHEQAARDLIGERWPQLFVSASHEVWPEQREYERTLVTVMNAYVGPRMQAYYADLERRLRAHGFTCPILVTQSNGGMLSIQEAARTPVRAALSGPAVGVTGAARLAAEAGARQVFTFDMGGTSADMSVVDGAPRLGTDSVIGDYPLFLPAVSIDTIGAGGGSIAWVDDHGVLKVGPQSAGAVPGPACYGRGGTQPTVTDVYLLSGILGENDLLGGAMQLSTELARKAVDELAARLDVPLAEATEGVLRVATANMYAELLPLIARNGVDQRDFVLMAFGGAGPTHAFLLAGEVGIPRVLVPAFPGAMCALGGALTDVSMDFVRSGHWRLSERDELIDAFTQLEERAARWLVDEGLDPQQARYEHSADMRYEGQSHELTVAIADLNAVDDAEAFHRRYEQVYSYRDPASPIEVLHLRLLARVPVGDVRLHRGHRDGQAPAPVTVRQVFLGGSTLRVPVYRRGDLPAGWHASGPMVITQYDTTTFVTPSFDVSVDGFGNLWGKARS